MRLGGRQRSAQQLHQRPDAVVHQDRVLRDLYDRRLQRCVPVRSGRPDGAPDGPRRQAAGLVVCPHRTSLPPRNATFITFDELPFLKSH